MESENFVATLGADGLRQKIVEVAQEVKSRAWELAGLLFEAKAQELYKAWGFEDWNDYIDKEVGLGRRAVNQQIANWKTYRLQLGVDTEDLRDLEWTKARVMQKIVTTENVHDWIEKASSSSREELVDAVRRLQAETAGDLGPGEPLPPLKHRSFAFDPEQEETVNLALAKARRIARTDSDTWAFDLICQAFLQDIDDHVMTIEQLMRRMTRMGYDVFAAERAIGEIEKVSRLKLFVNALNQQLNGHLQLVYVAEGSNRDQIEDVGIEATEEMLQIAGFSTSDEPVFDAEQLAVLSDEVNDEMLVDADDY